MLSPRRPAQRLRFRPLHRQPTAIHRLPLLTTASRLLLRRPRPPRLPGRSPLGPTRRLLRLQLQLLLRISNSLRPLRRKTSRSSLRPRRILSKTN